MVFSGHDLLIGNFPIIGLFAGMFQAIFQGLKKGSWHQKPPVFCA
jgi:hypothetical protein